jgi:hypothetical protein
LLTLAELGCRTSLWERALVERVLGGGDAEESMKWDGNLHDHLLAGEQAVGDELASSDRDLCVGHDCSRWGSRTAKEGCRCQVVAVRSLETAIKLLQAVFLGARLGVRNSWLER